MTKDELDVLARITLTRARGHIHDMYNEFESRYQDADSHALIAELRKRTDECITVLMPLPEVRTSGR